MAPRRGRTQSISDGSASRPRPLERRVSARRSKAQRGEPEQQHGGQARRGLCREKQVLQAQPARLDDQRRQLIVEARSARPRLVVSSP